MPENQGIWIITCETPNQETTSEEITRGGKSVGRGGYSYDDSVEEVDTNSQQHWVEAEVLQSNMNQFLEVLGQTFERAEQSHSKIQLDEIELTVEINGKGQVGLLGTGGELGGKGAIKLKFKRNNG